MNKKEIHEIIERFEGKIQEDKDLSSDAARKIVDTLKMVVLDYAIEELNERIPLVERIFPTVENPGKTETLAVP